MFCSAQSMIHWQFFGSVSFSSWWNQAVNNPSIGWSITDPIGHCSTRTGPPIYNDPLIFSGAISMERWRCVDRLIWFLIGIDRILVGMITVSLAGGLLLSYCITSAWNFVIQVGVLLFRGCNATLHMFEQIYFWYVSLYDLSFSRKILPNDRI